MPTFDDSTTVAAPPEDVWKILYDPARFPEWWTGVVPVEPGPEPAEPGAYTVSATGQPDFPIPQPQQTVRQDRRVVISCLVTDMRFDWQLEPLDGGASTRIGAHVDIPEDVAHFLDAAREAVSLSLGRLATLAAVISHPG